MTWKSSSTIFAHLETAENTDAIVRSFSLSRFANGFHTPDFVPSAEWCDAVSLSAEGQEILDRHVSILQDLDDATRRFLMFRMHYYHGLLIDPVTSDLTCIQGLLSDTLSSRQLRLPHRFGRLLYDRYNDHYGDRPTDHLRPEDADEFIGDTPQGVYQAGTLVSGPLGLIESADSRYAPPSLTLCLWHCSDPGCGAAHSVRLSRYPTPLQDAFDQLLDELHRAHGPPSEWAKPLRMLCRMRPRHDARPYYDLLAFLGDAVLGADRTALLALALRTAAAERLRAVTVPALDGNGSVALNPESLAEAIGGGNSAHQILMLLSDVDLVRLLDRAALSGAISLPATELRKAYYAPIRDYGLETPTEMSSLGVRSVGGNPTENVAARVWNAYVETDNVGDLNWILRNRPNGAPEAALLDYLATEDPRDSVRKLVLTREAIARHVARAVDVGPIDLSTQRAADIILWKLGFSLLRHDDGFERLRDRLTAFSETVRSIRTIDSEDAREVIRRSGVNLFVSIEMMLDRLITYVVWLLASDHLVGADHGVFDLARSRRLVRERLGESIDSGGHTLIWDAEGENTLGVLLGYLQQCLKWVEGLRAADREALLRSEEDYPHHAEWETIEFCFKHVELWADANEEELARFYEEFSRIVATIGRCQLAEIRNGLDHWREPNRFPGRDDLREFGSQFEEAVEIADAGRFVPKEWWLQESREDRFGRSVALLLDYQGRELTLRGPNRTSVARSFPSSTPVLVAPGNLLGWANSEMTFRVKQESQYANYWEGYPRRRRITPHEVRASERVDSGGTMEPLIS